MSEKLPLATPTPAARAASSIAREVVVEEPARADHDRDAALERERDVAADDRRMRVVDEHVGRAVEGASEIALERDAEVADAELLAGVAAGRAARDRRVQVEVARGGDCGHEGAPDAAESAADADLEGIGGDCSSSVSAL